MAPEEPLSPSDSVFGVVAHGLLNSMSVVIGTLTTLSDYWARLDDKTRGEILDRGVEQARFVTDTLRDLILGLPVGTFQVLEDLDVEATRRRETRL